MKRMFIGIILICLVAVCSGCGETFSGIGRDASRIGRGAKTIFIRDSVD
jgi:predicted small secreted protein